MIFINVTKSKKGRILVGVRKIDGTVYLHPCTGDIVNTRLLYKASHNLKKGEVILPSSLRPITGAT